MSKIFIDLELLCHECSKLNFLKSKASLPRAGHIKKKDNLHRGFYSNLLLRGGCDE
jgi:hypothetical protein